MSEINPVELGRQLKKPSGDIGLEVAENMNVSNASIYNFILQHLNLENDINTLEIGFGNGRFIPKYFEINPRIHLSAIDFSDIMCSEAASINQDLIQANKLSIKCEDSMSMSFANESFDVIVTINTVYFWEEIELQLEEIKRVTKKGGLFVIGYRPKSVMKDLPFAQEVFKLYDSEDLQSIVKQQGFIIIKEEHQTTIRKSVDGSEIQSTDSCLMLHAPY